MKDDLHIIRKEILSCIKDLDLNLTGLTVLTELASGLYIFIPFLCLLAGAEKVYAISKHTKYGDPILIEKDLHSFLPFFELLPGKIEVCAKEVFDNFHEIDIVTNLGNVRPLDRSFISRLKKKSVISYMCESWEFRKGDLDLEACKEFNIKVLGINENHPVVDCFKETSLIALQMVLESKISIFNSKILILSRDKFGLEIFSLFKRLTDQVHLLSDFLNFKNSLDVFLNANLIIIADYLYQDVILGNDGILTPNFISETCPEVKIIQFCGKNAVNDIVKEELSIYPKEQLNSTRMTRALDHISYRAFFRLISGGLKVGQIGVKHEIGWNDLVQEIC